MMFLTENGWPSCGYDDCDTSNVPGTSVSIPVQIGIPNTILKAFLADLHAYVEPYNGKNDWGGWTATNSVATSNHLGGTAVDFNWDDHPMGPAAEDPAAGWQGSSLIPGDEVPAVRDLLNWYEGMVFWGADWDTPKDSMHFQMGYDTYSNIPKCMDFISRKIRKDMFSTYKRGGDPGGGTPPVSTTGSAATALYDAVPVIDEARAAQLVDAVTAGLAAAKCTNVKRIAMFLAQTGHESAGYATTEEYASGAAYEDRGDLGNTQPGDGVRFKGRTWIQITGRSNYTKFSNWAASQGLISDPSYFVENPTALADLKWAGIGAAWYWTVARPTINNLCDNGDVVGVTQLINGGQNGITDRTARYNQAIALGDELLKLLPATNDPGDDVLSALSPDEQHELLDAVRWLKSQLGPTDPSWGADSSLGQDAKGNELTVRDGLAELKRTVEDPKVAIVTFQAADQPAAQK